MSRIFYQSIWGLAIFTSFLFLGCASHKKVNRLASKINCNQTIYFVYDEKSNDVAFEYSGKHWGQSDYPDFKETFKKSIETLDANTSMDLVYLDGGILPSGDLTIAKVRIKKIRWHFGISKITMEVDLSYDVDNNKMSITGKNKVQMAATKEGNLFKALKHGHFMFLSSFCDQ